MGGELATEFRVFIDSSLPNDITIRHHRRGDITASNGTYLFYSNVSGYDDANIMEIRATQDAFAGAVLEIGADRNMSDSFDLFRVTIDDGPLPREVFAVTGQGHTMIKRGGLTVTGPTVVKAGGLLIEAGGVPSPLTSIPMVTPLLQLSSYDWQVSESKWIE